MHLFLLRGNARFISYRGTSSLPSLVPGGGGAVCLFDLSLAFPFIFWVMATIGFTIGFFYPFSEKNINSHHSGVGLQTVFLGENQTIKVIF